MDSKKTVCWLVLLMKTLKFPTFKNVKSVKRILAFFFRDKFIWKKQKLIRVFPRKSFRFKAFFSLTRLNAFSNPFFSTRVKLTKLDWIGLHRIWNVEFLKIYLQSSIFFSNKKLLSRTTWTWWRRRFLRGLRAWTARGSRWVASWTRWLLGGLETRARRRSRGWARWFLRWFFTWTARGSRWLLRWFITRKNRRIRWLESGTRWFQRRLFTWKNRWIRRYLSFLWNYQTCEQIFFFK